MRCWRAWLGALWIVGLVTVTPLIACPFLKAQLAPDRPSSSCCHRKPAAPTGQCPFSTNLQSCPYFVSESKLGLVADTAVQAAEPLDIVDLLRPCASVTGLPVHTARPPSIAGSTLLVRIRVLRV